MTKAEALVALLKGEKITHRLFATNEFIHIVDESLLDEANLPLDSVEFWRIRRDPEWLDGWTIYTGCGNLPFDPYKECPKCGFTWSPDTEDYELQKCSACGFGINDEPESGEYDREMDDDVYD